MGGSLCPLQSDHWGTAAVTMGGIRRPAQDDPRVTQDEPRVTLDDPRVTRDDPWVTQDDPRVTRG